MVGLATDGVLSLGVPGADGEGSANRRRCNKYDAIAVDPQVPAQGGASALLIVKPRYATNELVYEGSAHPEETRLGKVVIQPPYARDTSQRAGSATWSTACTHGGVVM